MNQLSTYRQATLAFVVALTLLAGKVSAQVYTGAQALAAFDSTIGNYNLISLNNATLSNFGDIQGNVEVAGNLNVSGSSQQADNSKIFNGTANGSTLGTPTLYVGGTLSLSGTLQLQDGYASINGMSTSSSVATFIHPNPNQPELKLSSTYGGGTLDMSNAYGTSPDANIDPRLNKTTLDWTSIRTTLKNISDSLNAIAPTGTITVDAGQNLVFSAPSTTHSAVEVFTLDASLLSGNTYNGKSFSNVQINVAANQDYVVNVINVGSNTAIFSNANFNAGTNDSQLLWNIRGTSSTSSVTIGGGYGAILAPTVTLNHSSTAAWDGQIVGSTVNYSNAELHYDDFTYPCDLIPTPEPSTYGFAGLAMCFGIVGYRRYQQKRAALRS